MKSKSAMQELIDQLKGERLSNPIDSPLSTGLTVAIGFANKLLERERQQIVDAYTYADPYGRVDDAEDYYNQTYNTQQP